MSITRISDQDFARSLTTLKGHEAASKPLIRELAEQAIYNMAETGWSGRNNQINDLLAGVNASNRAMIALLGNTMTTYVYDAKAKKFNGKADGKSEEGQKKVAEAAKAFEEFKTKYKGDVWAWFEAKAEKKVTQLKFNPKALEKQILALAAEKGGFNDEFAATMDSIMGQAKVTHEKKENAVTYTEAQMVKYCQFLQTEAGGSMSVIDAMTKAVEDAKDGNIPAEAIAPVVAAE